LLLAALGAFQYESLQRSLLGNRVDTLRGDVDEGERLLVRTLSVGATAPAPAVPRPPTNELRAAQTLCVRDSNVVLRGRTRPLLLAQALACAVSVASGHTVAVVVYNRGLNPVAFAGGVQSGDIPRLDPAGLSGVAAGGASPQQVLDSTTGPQLVTALPVRNNGASATGSVTGVAQVSASTRPIDDVLASERRRLALGDAAVLVAALLAGLLLTGRALQPLRRLTLTARALAGGDLRARSRLAPRGDEVGTLAQAFDDMADRIEAAFAARADSEARMRRFVADASHELRTPVTGIKGYIDVIRRGAVSDPAALDAALEAMGREADRMRLLVLDLLTLARIDSQRALDREPVDLGEAVSSVLDGGGAGMPEELNRSLPVAPLVIRADREALTTILRNVLSNACKYAPGAAQTWTAMREDGRGVVRVHDEGPGIPATDLPHVFERFYRGEKTRAREEGGSGLGLSIVQGLALAMDGEVAIESVEGEGTTVTVSLPLAEADAATLPGPR
jgi:two-component system OmpR family sensor kinase